MLKNNHFKSRFSDVKNILEYQFSNLDPKDPSQWPLLPRLAVYAVIAFLVVLVGWYAFLSEYRSAWGAAQAVEVTLRQDYQDKQLKAVNLDALKQQREQAQIFVTQLEKQLPGRAEMSALLSDINQAGLGRSLQFELFRPGQVLVHQYYAELPIAIRVVGKYHAMGDFASDIAHLSRIVTLDNMAIAPGKDGDLSMDVTARTFRYLDAEEIIAQQAADKKPGASP